MALFIATLAFNSRLKVDFQGSRVTSDRGLLLVRKLDERLGLSAVIIENIKEDQHGKNIQLPLPNLSRKSIYSRLAEYEDVNDAERLSQDPTFRMIGSEKTWERGAALPSWLHWFETEVLTQDENLRGSGPTTGILSPLAFTRCCCSTARETVSVRSYDRAMCIAPRTGRKCFCRKLSAWRRTWGNFTLSWCGSPTVRASADKNPFTLWKWAK